MFSCCGFSPVMLRHDSFFLFKLSLQSPLILYTLFCVLLWFCITCAFSFFPNRNFGKLALPMAMFPLSGVRGVFRGAHTGITAFLCAHLCAQPVRKGDVGVCLCSPSFTYQSQAASEGFVWSTQGLVIESHQNVPCAWQPGPEALFALPGRHSVFSPAS